MVEEDKRNCEDDKMPAWNVVGQKWGCCGR